MSDDLALRLILLRSRLHTSYDGLGQSTGRPYLYFVYPPERERTLHKLVQEHLYDDASLRFYAVHLLPLVIESVAGQEEKRQQLLRDPLHADSTAGALLRIWTRKTLSAINAHLANAPAVARPVMVLSGLAALYPLSTPTHFMERIGDQEPRHPISGTMVPIVPLIPGFRPAQLTHVYRFLSEEHPLLPFYRGEDI
jgi:hypothetical protein